MNQKSSHFADNLLADKSQIIAIFGTSLSYHLAPILRATFQSKFGHLATVVNAGLAGYASRTALIKLEDKVLRHKPNMVLMEWAINDAHDYHHEPGAPDQGISLQESRENLEMLITRIYEVLPQTEVVLWTTNSTEDVEGSTMRGRSARSDLKGYYEGVHAVASARGLRLIDAEKFWAFTHDRLGDSFRPLIPDGVHPTPKALREYFVPFLLQELGFPEQTS